MNCLRASSGFTYSLMTSVRTAQKCTLVGKVQKPSLNRYTLSRPFLSVGDISFQLNQSP